MSGSLADTYVERDNPIPRNPWVFCHSGAGSNLSILGAVHTSVRPITRRTSRQGFAGVAVTNQPHGWGNDAALTIVDDAVDYHRASRQGTADGPVLFGVSAGATTCLRYTMDGTYTPAAVVLLIPVIDLAARYADNTGGNQTLIAAAWGVTAPAALPADADLLDRANEIGCPVLAYYASDDVWSDDIATMAAASPQPFTAVNVGALGHDNAAIAAADIDQLITFVQENA
jgi:pimeloyl-ACP methyl ester carboxylesterase